MEKSCESCRNKRCDVVQFTLCDENLSQYQPDYPTLKQENEELKKQIEKLQNEKFAFEGLYHTTEQHFVEDTVKNQKRIMELTQALERVCKAVSLNEGHRCPIERGCWSDHDCLCGDEACIKKLIQYFKEAVK